jgi:hypothetical protein
VLKRRHVQPRGLSIGSDAFDIQWLALGALAVESDPADELIPMIDIKDEYAMPAKLKIIPDTGRGDVEKALLAALERSGGRELPEQDDSNRADDMGEFAERHGRFPINGDWTKNATTGAGSGRWAADWTCNTRGSRHYPTKE